MIASWLRWFSSVLWAKRLRWSVTRAMTSSRAKATAAMAPNRPHQTFGNKRRNGSLPIWSDRSLARSSTVCESSEAWLPARFTSAMLAAAADSLATGSASLVQLASISVRILRALASEIGRTPLSGLPSIRPLSTLPYSCASRDRPSAADWALSPPCSTSCTRRMMRSADSIWREVPSICSELPLRCCRMLTTCSMLELSSGICCEIVAARWPESSTTALFDRILPMSPSSCAHAASSAVTARPAGDLLPSA